MISYCEFLVCYHNWCMLFILFYALFMLLIVYLYSQSYYYL